MKQCSRCKIIKSLSEFTKHSNTKDGKQPYCIDCARASALKFAKTTNKLRCYVGSTYIKRSHPFYVAGKRFKDWPECYAYWTKKSGVDFTHLNEQQNEEAKGQGFVYVIYNKAWDGWYKVGKAANVETRLKGYQTGDPHRAYKVCYEMEFENCDVAERTVLDLLQNDDKVIKKNEWVVTSLDRIRNIINEVKREEVSSGHRDELDSQFDLVLCN